MKCKLILSATLPQKVSQYKPRCKNIISFFAHVVKVVLIATGLGWDRRGRGQNEFAFHGVSIFFDSDFCKMLVKVSSFQEARSRSGILADPENAEGNMKKT